MKRQKLALFLIPLIALVTSCTYDSGTSGSSSSSAFSFCADYSAYLEEDKPDLSAVNTALAKGTVTEDYKDNALPVLIVALEKQAASSYAYEYTYDYSSSTTLTNSTIVRRSVHIHKENEDFFQVISSNRVKVVNMSGEQSKIANRYYENNGGILAYKRFSPDEWKQNTSENGKVISDQDYLDEFGKSFLSQYYVRTQTLNGTSHDDFSLSKADTREESGLTPFLLTSKTVKSSSLSLNEDGNYELKLELDPENATVYEKKFMIRCDELLDSPSFTSVSYSVELDKDLYPVESEISEVYRARLNTFNMPAKADYKRTSVRKFFHSEKEDGFTDITGAAFKLAIPEASDTADIFTTRKACSED